MLADVGGTNVRFAVLDRAGLGPVAHMAVNDYQNFADGLAAFMALQPNNTAIRYALFGVAGVVEDGRCALTNNAWVVDTAQLRARFGFAGSHIVNDFEAVAWSLPLLAASDLGMIGGGQGSYFCFSRMREYYACIGGVPSLFLLSLLQRDPF